MGIFTLDGHPAVMDCVVGLRLVAEHRTLRPTIILLIWKNLAEAAHENWSKPF